MGEIVAIWIKRFKRGPMDPVSEAEAVEGRGLKDNANQGGKRQVTIIDESRWREAEEELGFEVDPRLRRANLMLRGVDLERTNGRLLRSRSTPRSMRFARRRSEEHTSELQSQSNLVCRLLLEK